MKRYNEISKLIAGPNTMLFEMVFISGSFEFYFNNKPVKISGDFYERFRECFIKQDGFAFTKIYLDWKKRKDLSEQIYSNYLTNK